MRRNVGRGALRRLTVAAGLIWAGHAPAAVATLVVTTAIGAAPVVIAWLAKGLIDLLGRPQDSSAESVGTLVVGLVAAIAAMQLGQDGLRFLEAQLGRRVDYLAQARLFAKINSFQGLSWLERPRAHDQIHLARAASRTTTVLLSIVTAVIQHLVTLTGFMAAILTMNPLLAVLLVAAAAPQLAAQLHLAGRQVRLRRTLSPAERRQMFFAELQSDPRAAKELRLFGLGHFFRGRMLKELRRVHDGEQAMDHRILRVQAVLGAVSAVASAIALALVANAALAGALTPGDVVLFLAALSAVTSGLAQLVSQLAQAREAIGIVGHYDELMSVPTEAPPVALRTAPPLRDGIVFEDVWFRYGEDLPWVLQGVWLRIPAGASGGLVGSNGAGKSTIVKLLGRLYEPTRGRIRWDGVDLRELTHESLRDRIGAVFQDFTTYDMTAAENIGLGDLARLSDLTTVRRAAELAEVNEAVEALPLGYATMLSNIHLVGDDDDQQSGVTLSGGQWQRLALARMLMRADRDVLILDEPSAGLDAEAESKVNRVLLHETAGRTRLFISHRLNAVRLADRILVLEDGRIAETGSHDELIRLGGRYAKLFNLQASGYLSRTDHGSSCPG